MQTAANFQALLNSHQADAIVVFDGVCNFCNSSINFLMEKDQASKLRYMSLQSDLGQLLQQQLPKNMDSIICVTAKGIFIRSEAVLQIASLLPYPYRLLRLFRILPRTWRDYLYDTFSKRRYKWFGKSEQCRIPTAAERALFIETFGPTGC